MKILKFLICFLTLLNTTDLLAQKQAINISGIVLDSNTKNPIEFATITILDQTTKQAITGVTTDGNGEFKITVDRKDIAIQITFIGFTPKTIESFEMDNGRANLGTILLSEDAATLDEVVVQAEKSSTEFKLDKRVFNVGKDLSSTGASALEVLNNVPSVNVNIEGIISLRGSEGVQILINGKPSVIASEQGNALGTITAEMIEKIEVITNPSAKYDAEGTSGIINIVIKKEERKGINGSVSVNTGVPHNHSFGLSLNRRTEKFNLFSQIGIGYREIPNDSENINQDLVNNTTLFTTGTEYRNELFYNLVLGTDFHINKYNVLTLSGNFAYEVEDQPSQTDFRFVDETGSDVSKWYRKETTDATNPKWQYELQYKKNFKDHKEHSFLFSALGNFFGKDQSSEFENKITLGDPKQNNQQTRTDFKEAKYNFKIDYTKPFSKEITLETGAQYVIQDVRNDYSVSNSINNIWVTDEDLTNLFEYDQKVLGVYTTGAYEGNKWGLKLGLRLENTDLKTLLAATNKSDQQNYTNLFPSAHASYKITENFSLQTGYSKRIYRPRLWDLNPFFNIRNNFSVREGNPDLQPEFTDSYELASIFNFGAASFNLNFYHRYTTDVIERVSTFENNVNTFKPINIGTNKISGIELNGKYSPQKWLSINGDFNFNFFNRKGDFNDTSFDFSSDQWSTKLTTKFKLPAKIDFEITTQYESKVKAVQRVHSDNLYTSFGLRKKILKGKGVINFSIRDVFASRVRENEINQADFYLYTRRQRGRFITLGFSYGFGKGEAMEYSGKRRR